VVVRAAGGARNVPIEKNSNGYVSKLLLSGRIHSEQIASICSELNDHSASKTLDLSEVTLIDLAAVRFLIRCEDVGVELVPCPPYIREWMHGERVEGARSRSSDSIISDLITEVLFALLSRALRPWQTL